jgi:hypothetical protein
MADVRAGSHQRSAASGELGIVTVWVRASSVSAALKRAGAILNDRRYASIGTLHCYAEELGHDPLACTTEIERATERREDELLFRYDALKQCALAQADGLHEVWLGEAVPKAGRAAAA